MKLIPDVFRRKKVARPVGDQLETGVEEVEELSTGRLVRSVMWASIIIAATFAFSSGLGRDTADLAEDQVWRDDDVIAPSDFAIFKSPEEIAEDGRTVRANNPAIFEPIQVRDQIEDNFSRLRGHVAEVTQAYSIWQASKGLGDPNTAADSSRYASLASESSLQLSAQQWGWLAQSEQEGTANSAANARGLSRSQTLVQRLIDDTYQSIRAFSNGLVTQAPLDSLLSDTITLRDNTDRTEQLREKSELLQLSKAQEATRQSLFRRYPGKADTVAIGEAFFDYTFLPNVAYSREQTESMWAAAESRISHHRGKVIEGEIIVRRGERLTTDNIAKLQSMYRVQDVRYGNQTLWRKLLGQFFLALASILPFMIFIRFFRRDLFDSSRDTILIGVLFLMTIVFFAFVARLDVQYSLMVPVALAPVLLTIIYDSRLGFIASFVLAILGGAIFGFDFEYVVLAFTASTLAALSVRDIRNRAQFMITALVAFVASIVVLSVFYLFDLSFEWRPALVKVGYLAISAFLLLFSLPLVWMFERVFSVTTEITLLELSDTNRPLLRDLALRAPGTFSHSLQVANLGEAAAEKIGADALLTRVGALYHDIGKGLKPEYYIENQQGGENPHDKLAPSMSALIIGAHVKDGLEMAKEKGLPEVVQEFITMHHGTCRMEFFYNKAIEATEDPSEILESDYRYPGPRPRSKETAIVMLADSVEAASKSVASSGRPTPKKFETLITGIFSKSLEDGQLDNSPLTFLELGEIRETFVSLLSGMYHFRPSYPGQEEGEDKPDEGEGEASEKASSNDTMSIAVVDSGNSPSEQPSQGPNG